MLRPLLGPCRASATLGSKNGILAWHGGRFASPSFGSWARAPRSPPAVPPLQGRMGPPLQGRCWAAWARAPRCSIRALRAGSETPPWARQAALGLRPPARSHLGRRSAETASRWWRGSLRLLPLCVAERGGRLLSSRQGRWAPSMEAAVMPSCRAHDLLRVFQAVALLSLDALDCRY